MHVFAPRGLGLIAKNSPLAVVDESIFNIKEIMNSNPEIKIETDIVLVFNKTGIVTGMIGENTTKVIDNGKYTVIIVKYGDIFHYDRKIYYVRSNEIFVSKNLDEVITFKDTKNRMVKRLGKDEQDALAWLDNGEKGVSSLSICYTLFPNLRKHNSFSGTALKHPSDVEAAMRCVGFFEDVPDALVRIDEMRELSSQWNYVVNHWDVITKAVKDKNTELLIETLKNIDKI